MITIKKPSEVKMIGEGGRKLATILDQLAALAKPGVTTQQLDQQAEVLIRQAGGEPSFKGYRDSSLEPPFPSTICASVNNQLVHTPAGDYTLKQGDILTIDIGMRYPAQAGFYTDMAVTIPIGPISAEVQRLLTVTRESLVRGIAAVKPGNFISDISRVVQEHVEKNNFSVVRRLVGHGVGYAVHEEPRVPNFFDPKQPKIELKPGMVLAIEPMVAAGNYDIETLDDGWTIVMADGSLCAHFEHTVAVTKNGVKILTVK